MLALIDLEDDPEDIFELADLLFMNGFLANENMDLVFLSFLNSGESIHNSY